MKYNDFLKSDVINRVESAPRKIFVLTIGVLVFLIILFIATSYYLFGIEAAVVCCLLLVFSLLLLGLMC